MVKMRKKGMLGFLIFVLVIAFCFSYISQANAYYGLYGGLYGGYYGGYGYSPFSYYNLYYPVETAGGLTYQVPFLQIAPLLGIAGLYNQLFPNLFNPLPQAAPIVNVSTPTTLGVTFPTPVNVLTVT